MIGRFFLAEPPSSADDGAAGIERQYVPDRTVDDVDDPDLGAAAMEDAVVGDDAEPGGTGLTASFEDWPDDAEAKVAPHRQPTASSGA